MISHTPHSNLNIEHQFTYPKQTPIVRFQVISREQPQDRALYQIAHTNLCLIPLVKFTALA